MKYVNIAACEQPKSFESVRFSQKDWEAANKLGPVRVPFIAAKEAMKNSGGLYEIVKETETVEVTVKASKSVKEMSNEELVAEMSAFGKPPRKKMSRSSAEDFVTKLRQEAAANIVDDDEDEKK